MRSPAFPTPRPSARPSANCSSTCSTRSQEDRRRRIPGAGHALSRRDRKRVVHRRAVGDDQVAPQCRRPARAHEHEARRAVARAVQGRGARARPRARPAEAFVGRHPFPGPGLAIRFPARSRARSSISCARRMRSISMRSAAPGSTMTSGRPSPCCCRCAPSASWATAAPTTMSGPARGDVDRRHDGRLLPLRHGLPRPRRDPHHQRGQGRQPRRLRRDLEAAGHDRVGVRGVGYSGGIAENTVRAPAARMTPFSGSDHASGFAPRGFALFTRVEAGYFFSLAFEPIEGSPVIDKGG